MWGQGFGRNSHFGWYEDLYMPINNQFQLWQQPYNRIARIRFLYLVLHPSENEFHRQLFYNCRDCLISYHNLCLL